jgi:Rrf2 family transcriptional regulator, iron-sulfur cluster assembly transcription factor
MAMQVTARAEYACLAMLELAVRYDDSKPIRLAEVADKHGIPHRFLVQILLQLKTSGLIRTRRGMAGGYQLANKPETITLADIFGVFNDVKQSSAATLSRSDFAKNLHSVWLGLQTVRQEYLSKITLKDLLPTPDSSNYSI